MEDKSIHGLAAQGDVEALNQLAAVHYTRAESGIEPAVIALAKACTFARLAALRGEREEMITFLFLLEQHAHALRDVGLLTMADEAQGEAVALAEHMADDGDEELGRMVVAAADMLTPGVFMVARDLRGLEIH
ncbi:hypothetical protein ACFO0A_00685 [Novosphingobium tardum]|uniref:Uncharacterized protein n=1 Tax=Novosphingobium tardum TaxID=1538021 RepID=A0ABV8RJH3_9SPHN